MRTHVTAGPWWASPPPRSPVTCDQIRGRKAQSTACVPAIMALVQDASLFAEEREVSIGQDRRLIEVSSLPAWTHACCAHGCVLWCSTLPTARHYDVLPGPAFTPAPMTVAALTQPGVA